MTKQKKMLLPSLTNICIFKYFTGNIKISVGQKKGKIVGAEALATAMYVDIFFYVGVKKCQKKLKAIERMEKFLNYRICFFYKYNQN